MSFWGQGRARAYLHEPRLLVSVANSAVERKRPDKTLHKKLAREAEDYGVKGNKSNVVWAFAVHGDAILLVQGLRRIERIAVAWRESVGEEDRFVEGV